jgi:hypothetical protein
MLDGRKYGTFLQMQQHFLIYYKGIVMLDGRKMKHFLKCNSIKG